MRNEIIDDDFFEKEHHRVSVYGINHRESIEAPVLKKQLNTWCAENTTDKWLFFLFSYPKYGISYFFRSESDAINFKLSHLELLDNDH